MANTPIVPPLPSATVILLRDAGDNIETLLLRRNSRLSFHGGAWVFPGGRIDPEDYVPGAQDEMLVAARRAAAREAQEEAGLPVIPDDLICIAHWTTPEGRPERFSTWFFAAAAGDDTVLIDGEEIHDHRWVRPDHALTAQREKEIELPPPTFVTLTKLSQYRTVRATLANFAERQPEIFIPRNHKVPGGLCSLYSEDAGYADGDVNQPGQRHRLWMLESGWRYERS